MKVSIALFTLLFAGILCAADEGWQVTEEVAVNGSRVTKRSYFTDRHIKVVNEAESGSNETIIDLESGTITLINHFQKSYQVSKLSDYIAFAEGIASGLKNGGYANPEKLEPKIAFEKKGTEKVGEWNALRFLVKVDGKEYMEMWVAPELKTSPLIDYRKKYAALLPESLVKYRAIDEKIKDMAAADGLIVRMTKIPLNKKLPKVDQRTTAIAPMTITPALLTIPKGYADKTIPTPGTATAPAPSKK